MIKGVFFDLGGTLFSYRAMSDTITSVLSEFAHRQGIDMDVSEILHHYRLANKATDKEFSGRSFFLGRDYISSTFLGLVKRLNHGRAEADCEWFEERYRTKLIDNLVLMSDCHQTLDSLKARNLYLSVVSNIDENMLHPLIEREGLHAWLDHWTSSEAAQSCKPDSRFFEIALQKSGLAPEEVIFVGDSTEQDILGAYNAGMRTALISEDGSAPPMHLGIETPEPDYRISELSALVEIIEHAE